MSSESENKIIGRDLCKLAELLLAYQLCNDTSALNTAGQTCMHSSTDVSWGYELGKIVFKIDEVGGVVPTESEDFSISLSISIEGQTPQSETIVNPLTELTFDLEIDGIHSDSLIPLYASWHLDRHIFTSDDGQPKYSHPLYHFTFGGDKMEAKGDSFGMSLILPAPRIAYPPMDAMLGIDFILQNYIRKEKLQDILCDPDYVEMMKRAQIRLWKPYFTSILSHWAEPEFPFEPDFSCKMIFPLYH